MIPSPHLIAQDEVDPTAPIHEYPRSGTQFVEQPVRLPLSHCSVLPFTPSPHFIEQLDPEPTAPVQE